MTVYMELEAIIVSDLSRHGVYNILKILNWIQE